MEIETWWQRLQTCIDATGRDPCWNPGARDETIAKAEEQLGIRLPEDYRWFLLQHDGQHEDFELSVLCAGGRLAPIDAVVERHQDMLDWEDHDEAHLAPFEDHHRVLGPLFHSGRIDIGGNLWFDSDNTVLDFIPGPTGTMGQVLALAGENFWVAGTSFTDFIRRTVLALERDLLTFRFDGEVMTSLERVDTSNPYATRCEHDLRRIEPSLNEPPA